MAQRAQNERSSSTRPSRGEPVVVEVDEIVLDNVKVQVRNQDLPLNAIELDPANPRIAYTVQLGNYGAGGLQSTLETLLWKDEDVRHKLYQGIRENGGLIERIIVR